MKTFSWTTCTYMFCFFNYNLYVQDKSREISEGDKKTHYRRNELK